VEQLPTSKKMDLPLLSTNTPLEDVVAIGVLIWRTMGLKLKKLIPII